jgi:uncharacterized protein (TIGR01777 family)
MDILIAGATGFVGKALINKLLEDGHKVTALGRSSSKINKIFSHTVTALDWNDFLELPNDDFNKFNLIINLAGAGIADMPWTKARKIELYESRIDSTSTLVSKINHSGKRHKLINASAIGIYQEKIDSEHEYFEDDQIENKTFLSSLVYDWEKEALKVKESNSNLIILRLSIILDSEGGFLKKVTPSIKLGFGAILGDGKQLFPWISLSDLIDFIRYVIKNENIEGVYNVCSSIKTTQEEFFKEVARQLKRPLLFKVPAFILKLVLKDFAKELLLSGQNISNKKLINSGFILKENNLEQAIKKSFR